MKEIPGASVPAGVAPPGPTGVHPSQESPGVGWPPLGPQLPAAAGAEVGVGPGGETGSAGCAVWEDTSQCGKPQTHTWHLGPEVPSLQRQAPVCGSHLFRFLLGTTPGP